MIKNLLEIINSHGDRGAVVPFSRIYDLKEDFANLKNGDFQTDWINRMANHMEKFIPSDPNFEPRSLISVVMPSPKVILQFNYRGKSVQCVVPPIYIDWDKNNNEVSQYISEYLKPLGFSAAKVITLPQKMLAVHCGLGLYGRNNICYNEEFGSYMQIMTYISDMPCDESEWFPLRRMDICETCRACVDACPTGAIYPDSRLINSDSCLTYYNEPGEDFPEWLDTNAHNSIIGCIKCQDCCPANAHNKDNIETGVTFTEEETINILTHNADPLVATGILPEYIKVIPRNLAVLLKQY